MTARTPGTNDLPSMLSGSVVSNVGVDLMEATGYGPDSETVTGKIDLLAVDMHSANPLSSKATLERLSNGAPSYTCERWVRLRFTPPFGAILKLRFWVDNYAPSDGWEVRYGTTSFYRKPSTSASDIATVIVPATDPGVSNLGDEILTGGQIQYSNWIVLQATWMGTAAHKIQADPLDWQFDWTDI